MSREPQEPTPEMVELKKRLATGQLANQMFAGLALESHNKEANPEELADRAFALAEAFDERLRKFIERPMSKIQVVSELPK